MQNMAEILRKKGFLTAAFTDHVGLRNKSVISKGFDVYQNSGQGRAAVTSHIVTENVINWLSKNHENRFFLWVHYFDPHLNYNPLPEYEDLFGFSEKESGRIYNGIDTIEILKIAGDLIKNCFLLE